MKAGTVQIMWHDELSPVLSVDFHPISGLLATAGADHDIKLWTLTAAEEPRLLPQVKYEANLSSHATAVNVVRFSPSGEDLASGADGGDILLWRYVENKGGWKVLKTLRCHLKDVLDVAWSADGNMLASGSVDNSCIIWNIAKGAPLQTIQDHMHYVQGVAWDPAGHYLASMSCDRSCRIYSARSQRGGAQAYTCQQVITKADFRSEDATTGDNKVSTKCHLFLDETMNTFFRRLAWSPDGSFLLLPAGVYKANGVSSNSAFAFSRNDFSRPVLRFPTASAVVATAFCPATFALEGNTVTENCAFRLPYRLLFAVATVDSVVIYETQLLKPLAVLAGVHYSSITDLAWSSDAKYLVISSRDGYCTVAEFADGELGQKLSSQGTPQRAERGESEMDERAAEKPANPVGSVRPNKSRRITPVAI